MLPTRYRLLAAAGGGAHSTHRADGPRARQQQRSPSPDAHRSHLTCHSQISLHRLPHTPVGRQTQRKAPVSATTQAGAAYHHMTTTAAGRDRGSYSCQSPRSRPVTCSEGSEPRVGRTAPSGRRSRTPARSGDTAQKQPRLGHSDTQSSEIGRVLETPVWSVAQGKKTAWREAASKLRRSRSPSANRPAQLAGPTHPLQRSADPFRTASRAAEVSPGQ